MGSQIIQLFVKRTDGRTVVRDEKPRAYTSIFLCETQFLTFRVFATWFSEWGKTKEQIKRSAIADVIEEVISEMTEKKSDDAKKDDD